MPVKTFTPKLAKDHADLIPFLRRGVPKPRAVPVPDDEDEEDEEDALLASKKIGAADLMRRAKRH